MRKLFEYNAKEGIFNDIIDSVAECARLVCDNKGDTITPEQHKDLNNSIVKYMLEGTRYEDLYDKVGSKAVLNPAVPKNGGVKENFEAIIVEMINATAPMVSSAQFANELAEVRQVGWGDTARFIVKSNGMFKVNEIAEGVTRGALQHIYNDEVTVNASTFEIATSIDWIAVASGVFQWGDFAISISRSFNGFVFLKVLKAMTSAITDIGAAYSVGGVDTSNWTTIADRVSAANNGASVYAIGTLAALNSAMPATAGLQYGLGQEIAKNGALDRYLGTPLIPITQVLVPGTTNSTADLAIPTDKIYMIAAGGNRPVKVVYEGGSVIIENIPSETTDKTYGFSIKMKIGVAAVVGSKFGVITIGG